MSQNLCVICGVDMGEMNPRQLCRKTYCERELIRKTYVINIIGGPGIGKTTMSALLFARLKMKKYIAEYVQEYAKKLVWLKKYDILNDQYKVSTKQYKVLKSMVSEVDFIITDGPLLHGIYYNRENKSNTSNVEKTEEKIKEYYNSFNNINILLIRGNYEYEQAGRYHTENQAKQIDIELKKILNQLGLEYLEISAEEKNIDQIIKYIEEYISE